MYVQCALFVLVHAYLCVIGLYEMEKAGSGLFTVGGVCIVKNEQRLPSDCAYILQQRAARPLGEGQ